MENQITRRDYILFSLVGMLWLVIGVGIVVEFSAGRSALILFGELWLLGVLDLLFLTKTVAMVLALVSETSRDKNTKNVAGLLIWATLKLACLGMIAWVLRSSTSAPALPKALGIATLFVVPMLGGIGWSQTHARRTRI